MKNILLSILFLLLVLFEQAAKSEGIFPVQNEANNKKQDISSYKPNSPDVHVSIHDLRRTFDDMAQRCKVGENESRQLLNHMASDVHGKHYSNNPDPAALLPAVESIGQWVLEQAAIAKAVEEGKNVLPLRA